MLSRTYMVKNVFTKTSPKHIVFKGLSVQNSLVTLKIDTVSVLQLKGTVTVNFQSNLIIFITFTYHTFICSCLCVLFLSSAVHKQLSIYVYVYI